MTRPTMKKLPIIALSLVAAATLAACGGRSYEASATPAPQAAAVVVPSAVVATPVVTYPSGTVAYVPAPGTVTYVQATANLRPGYGRIETIQQVLDTNGTWNGFRRITLRMEDGSIQVLDTRGPNMAAGERVEITSERNIRYPVASR